MKKKNPKAPNLSIRFTRWLVSNKYTTEAFVGEARKRGLPLSMSTVHKWRMGTEPRLTLRALVEAKFEGVTF